MTEMILAAVIIAAFASLTAYRISHRQHHEKHAH